MEEPPSDRLGKIMLRDTDQLRVDDRLEKFQQHVNSGRPAGSRMQLGLKHTFHPAYPAAKVRNDSATGATHRSCTIAIAAQPGRTRARAYLAVGRVESAWVTRGKRPCDKRPCDTSARSDGRRMRIAVCVQLGSQARRLSGPTVSVNHHLVRQREYCFACILRIQRRLWIYC